MKDLRQIIVDNAINNLVPPTSHEEAVELNKELLRMKARKVKIEQLLRAWYEKMDGAQNGVDSMEVVV